MDKHKLLTGFTGIKAPFCIFTFEITLVCKDVTHYLLQFIKKFLKVQTFEKIK